MTEKERLFKRGEVASCLRTIIKRMWALQTMPENRTNSIEEFALLRMFPVLEDLLTKTIAELSKEYSELEENSSTE